MGLRVDLGCGPACLPGYVGLDREDYGQAYVRDLAQGLPWSDGTVSVVHCAHVLEHLPPGEAVWWALAEIWRVCHDGAEVTIRVPHADTPEAAWPAHASRWTEDSLRLFLAPHRAPASGVPPRYRYAFEVLEVRRHGLELVCRARAVKPAEDPEAAAARGPVDAIVVAWNQLAYTQRCLESLRRHALGHDLRILVVDNASTDRTPAWLEQARVRLGLEVLRLETNRGWIGGVNAALAHVRPEARVILLANNDIVVGPGYLDGLLAPFAEVGVGAVGPVSNYVSGRQHVRAQRPGQTREDTETLIGFCMAIRASAWQAVGWGLRGHGDGGADDLDLSIRLRDAGWRLVIAREVYVHHHGSVSFRERLGGEAGYERLWREAEAWLVAQHGRERVTRCWRPTGPHLVCAVPYRTRLVDRAFVGSFVMLDKPWRFEYVEVPDMTIDAAREAAAAYACEVGADALLMLDADHLLPRYLVRQLWAHEVPIVSALACQRRPPHAPCIYRWTLDDQGRLVVAPAAELVRRGLQRVDATGMSAILIRTEALRQVPRPWFEPGPGLEGLGEDLRFCRRAADAGVAVWCDTDLVLPHLGDPVVVTEAGALGPVDPVRLVAEGAP